MLIVSFIILCVGLVLSIVALVVLRKAWAGIKREQDAYDFGRIEAARAVDTAWSNAIKEENAEEVRKRKLAIIAEYRERQLELEKAIKLEEFKRGKIQTDNIEEGRKLLIPDNLTEEEQMIVKEFYNL